MELLPLFLYFSLFAYDCYRTHKMWSEELWSVPLCLFLCSFSLSSSFLVEELSSHCLATICSHHLNPLLTDLVEHNPVCSTDLSDTFLCLLHQIYFLTHLVLYVRYSLFWFWFTSFCLRYCSLKHSCVTGISAVLTPFAFVLKLPKQESIA